MILSTFLLLLLATTNTISTSTSTASTDDECTLYLAPTTANEWHIVTAIPRPAGALIGFPDLVIPLMDLPLHAKEETARNALDAVSWHAREVGGLGEAAHVQSLVMGGWTMSLSHTVTHTNTIQTPNALLLPAAASMPLVNRQTSPGAGASSHYHAAAVLALHDIRSGHQIRLLHASQEENHHDKVPFHETSSPQQDAVAPEQDSSLWSLLHDSVPSRLQRFLPPAWASADVTTNDDDDSHRHPHDNQDSFKTREWLTQHGLCMDNIIQGPSHIPHAGRGAFATRFLSKGSLVAPAPVLHIANKSLLNLHHVVVGETQTDQHQLTDEIAGLQLLLNYCFGHQESTHLLCPMGSSTGFINHSPTPNVALRWKTLFHNETVPEQPLLLEYYALRDIDEDEEITIHYGAEWQQAWENHVAHWTPLPQDDEYISAAELNAADLRHIKTIHEQAQHPYPHSIVTSCFYPLIEDEGMLDNSGKYSDDHDVIVQQFRGLDAQVPDYMVVRPCRILERSPENFYTVQLLHPPDAVVDKIPDSHMVLVQQLPRDAITFTDFYYTSDIHLPNAFRHEMMLPDGLFPDEWRNSRDASS